jgi:hypothetical protein
MVMIYLMFIDLIIIMEDNLYYFRTIIKTILITVLSLNSNLNKRIHIIYKNFKKFEMSNSKAIEIILKTRPS